MVAISMNLANITKTNAIFFSDVWSSLSCTTLSLANMGILHVMFMLENRIPAHEDHPQNCIHYKMRQQAS